VQNEHSILFRVEADVYAETIVELGLRYKQLTQKDIDLEKLLVLSSIYASQKLTFAELEKMPYVNMYQLRRILEDLQELELIETTGKTSGMKYIIHKNMLETVQDEKQYLKNKKQTAFKHKQIILRYIEEFDEISNKVARDILGLPETDIYYISRLFKELRDSNDINVLRNDKGITYYGKADEKTE
jgi:ATP-dependent DNA helicase RecG